jgi:uncharacterized protein YciI
MSLFAVTREAGPGWHDGGGIDVQPAVADHAAFMQALADDGFVLAAGPLAGSEDGRLRVLLIADAARETEVHERLTDDPWVKSDQLRTVRVERWNVFVGAERLSVR